MSPSRSPLSGQGAHRFGGRWNPPDEFPAIYLAHPRRACIAELHRGAALAASQAHLGPRRLYTLAVDALSVLDLTGPEQLSAVGLTYDHIEDDDRSACQEVGRAVHFLGFQGIHAPSATSAGFVLAAFDRHLEPEQLTVQNEEDLDPEDLDAER